MYLNNELITQFNIKVIINIRKPLKKSKFSQNSPKIDKTNP